MIVDLLTKCQWMYLHFASGYAYKMIDDYFLKKTLKMFGCLKKMTYLCSVIKNKTNNKLTKLRRTKL